jgi:hypothetical protein
MDILDLVGRPEFCRRSGIPFTYSEPKVGENGDGVKYGEQTQYQILV